MRFSSLTSRVNAGGAGAWLVHERAMGRRRAGEDVIVLSIGDPDCDAPAAVTQAAVRSLRAGRTHYSPARGEQTILAVIADAESSRSGRVVTTDQVVFFPGAQAALFAVLACLAEHGDQVIVPEPAYATYEGVVATTGAAMVHVPLAASRRFALDAAAVERAITPRTRVVLVNSPHNPTGSVAARADLEAVARLCADHDLWLVTDEVYATLVFDGEHTSALALDGYRDRVAVVSSLSKSHAMTGFRHGWAVVPAPLADALDLLLQSMLFGSPPFVQDAGIAALREASDTPRLMRERYGRRARVVCDALAGVGGVVPLAPQAGMFVIVDVRATGLDATAFAVALLEEEAVSVLPTDQFGPSGAGYVRIGLAASDRVLEAACERIARFTRRRVPN